MSIKRWISGAAVALAGVGLLGALGAGQLEDLSLDRVTVGGKIPGAEVLNDLVGTTPSPAGDRQAGAAPAAGPAAEQLELLPITEYRPSTAYAREAFGQRWADTDRNGCDQRNDVLRRDLRETVIKLLDVGNYVLVYLTGALVVAAQQDWRLALPFVLWGLGYAVLAAADAAARGAREEFARNREIHDRRDETGVSGILYDSAPMRFWDHDLPAAQDALWFLDTAAVAGGVDPVAAVRRVELPEGRLGQYTVAPDGTWVLATVSTLLPEGTQRSQLWRLPVAAEHGAGDSSRITESGEEVVEAAATRAARRRGAHRAASTPSGTSSANVSART